MDKQTLKIERTRALFEHLSINGMKMQCLDSENSLHDSLSSTNQVIIMMPAKAAGSTLKTFARQCNKASGLTYEHADNFLNTKDNHFDGILTNSFRMPPVIASHINSPENVIYLMKNAPRSTLLIYVHRDETSRIQSAINQVVWAWCAGKREPPKDFFSMQEDNVCHTSEENLVDIGIAQKQFEIGLGASELLHCETYDSIVEHAPNILFVNYKHASDLQELLSLKYCPGLYGEPFQTNVGSEKSAHTFVQVANDISGGSELVSLADWLEAKMSALEWALGLHEKATCRAKTRIMEDKLFGCASGFMKASVVEG